ncbi:hypothetical protein EON82_12015 [bacterium]|nr:MAG: hypothetical protein EON82_12015 [bacterium]
MHRLFLGLPIDTGVAESISAWASSELTGTRVVPSENLHVTLLFFGSVDEATRDRLIGLTQETVWEPIAARTGELAAFGKSTLALRLEVAEEQIERLEDRLARASKIAPPGMPFGEFEDWMRTWSRPEDLLHQMALLVQEPDKEKKRRCQRQQRPLELHLTVARTKSRPVLELSEKLPPVDLVLDRLVLFESHLGPEGSRYEVLAEAGR